MMKKLWIPAVALVTLIGIFALAAGWMARNPIPAASTLPPKDPARVGASLGEQAVERFELPEAAASEAIAPEAGESGEPLLGQKSQGSRTASPFFWMAAGALCASAGILVATREKKTRIFTKW